jgi:surface protein
MSDTIGDITIIDDTNIRDLVIKYEKYKEQLPADLIEKQIGHWDVSRVTNMDGLFDAFPDFNEPLNDWNVSNVTTMKNMFSRCYSFNQPLDKWDVSNVEYMEYMFLGCRVFNEDLNKWIVSNVTDMEGMFTDCQKFNQPLDNWDVSKVTTMENMFDGCREFNQPVNTWIVSNVSNMYGIFNECRKFNQPLDNWNVSNATNMGYMFNDCRKFNQPLNNWIVSNVTIMEYMFSNCKIFNQPLDNWNVSNVTNMENMFFACHAFNQPLNNWDVRNVINDEDMFEDCIISDENMPIFQEINQDNEINRIKVDPLQMHKEAFKTNYEKLSDFLKEKLNNIDVPDNIIYSTYINDTLLNIIDNHYNDDNTERNMKIEGLERIMNERLNSLNYREQSNVLLKCIFYTLEYVKVQPAEFKKIYVDTFIKECVTAYEGPDGMTCALGALERVVRSLVNPCTTILSKGEKNDDYETIIAIIVRDPVKLIPEYIRDWYKSHKIGTATEFSDKLTSEDKRKNLKKYLLEFFPDEGDLIESKIKEIADNIGYDTDDFTYGGRRKKIRKSVKSQKNNKNKKSHKSQKNNKNKKSKTTLKKRYNKTRKSK